MHPLSHRKVVQGGHQRPRLSNRMLSGCSHHVRASAASVTRLSRSAAAAVGAAAAAAGAKAATAPHAGLVCIQDAHSPGDYVSYWQRTTRPLLDGLWSSILRSSNPERVLLSLDRLLMLLRSSRSLAVHIQQQHEDPAWAEAAAKVAADCRKYEAYVCGNKTVAAKLRNIQARLAAAGAGRPADTTPHSPGQQDHKLQQQQQQQQQQMLLQLAIVLLAIVNDNLPMDSLEWLAAIELPQSNALQLQQLQQQERDVIAAIDAAINQPAVLELPIPLSELLQDQSTQVAVAVDTRSATTSSGSSSSISISTSKMQSGKNGLTADATAVAAESEPSPECNEADSGSDGSHVVLVTRGLLAQLLCCDVATVRRQAYASVLQPKLTRVAGLLGQLSRCRQHQAQLVGCSSYFQQTQQRLAGGSSGYISVAGTMNTSAGDAASDINRNDADISPVDADSSPVDFLLQLSSSLHDLAQQEVTWVMQQGKQQQQQQQQQQAQDEQQQHVRVASGPWDWDWLQHKAHQPLLGALRDPTLQQHMHLEGLLVGLNCLLQQLLGVQLLLRPAGPNEVWGQHVMVLMVVRRKQQGWSQTAQANMQAVTQQQASADEAGLDVLGVVYLDVGGSYGTRLLRFTRQQQQQQLPQPRDADAAATIGSIDSSNAASAAVAECQPVMSTRVLNLQQMDMQQQELLLQQCQEVPAVAVGLSGSRITVAADTTGQQQQEVQEEGYEQQDEAFSCVGGCQDALVLSFSQLWELGHEMGHALHLTLSRQPACHLSGRFLPPSLLEVPSQVFERLMTSPATLAQLCRHHRTFQPLPPPLCSALATYYSSRYSSPLALSARVAVGLAEHMYARFGGDGCDYWRGSWEAVSGLPEAVAEAGSVKELSLLPVMAAHQGTYHCYLTSWCIAAQLCERIFQPLLHCQTAAASTPAAVAGTCDACSGKTVGANPAEINDMRKVAAAVFSMHAGMSQQEVVKQLANWCGIPPEHSLRTCQQQASVLDVFVMSSGMPGNIHRWLWKPNATEAGPGLGEV